MHSYKLSPAFFQSSRISITCSLYIAFAVDRTTFQNDRFSNNITTTSVICVYIFFKIAWNNIISNIEEKKTRYPMFNLHMLQKYVAKQDCKNCCFPSEGINNCKIYSNRPLIYTFSLEHSQQIHAIKFSICEHASPSGWEHQWYKQTYPVSYF